jgi:outer membrane receptor protein involved in Fe transport
MHRIGSAAGLALAAMLVVTAAALAGTTGTLKGRVTDDKNAPLTGVNIRIEGQRLGALSDESGNFVIVGIPGGTFVVRANLVGYGAYAAQNVSITPDFTTTLNVTLRAEAIPQAAVTVTAQRPLLQRDATGTTRVLSNQDIQKLPTRGYRDAAAQQTGVVNFQRNIDNEASNSNTLIIRGGRPNETAYFVDGFSQQDPLTGTSTTAISNNAISEMVVLTGGFNAEYGRIMSGAVNVVTREGGPKYFGSVEGVSDALAGGWLQAPRTDYNIYDFTLGGPIVPGRDRFTFFVSAEHRWLRDRSPSYLSPEFRAALRDQGLRDDLKPSNSSLAQTYQGKLAFQITNADQLKIGGLRSSDDWRQYLHSYLFDLTHTPRYADRNQNYYATFNHVFNNRTFANLGVNWFDTRRKRGDGALFDDIAGYYVPGGNTLYDTSAPLFWKPGHVFDDYLQRASSYYGVQATASSQVNKYHQLKGGADFQYHTLRFFNHFFPTNLGGANPDLNNWDGYGYAVQVGPDGLPQLVDVDSGRDGPKHPKVWSTYLQDKYERSGVIVNAGLRFDHLDVNTPALVNEQYPLGVPGTPGNNPDLLEDQDLTKNRTYGRLSPRIGIAFPVDDKTILRFNYGKFYQQPNLQDLYVSYRFLQYKVQTGGYFVGFGNPNLRPEQTTAYEVGLQRQLGAQVRLDATAYYKDVHDLVEITTISSHPKAFSSYRNRDFATVRGLDVGLTMRPINHLSGNLAYSLTYAQGTGSVSNTQRNIAWVGSETPKQTEPLDFDQRHKISINADYALGKGDGPAWGGRRWLENLDVNALLNIASGTPYTPTKVFNELTLAAVSTEPIGPVNSRYGPWNLTVDLKATRGFDVGGFRLEGFVWALNVFDSRNPVIVYSSTGNPESTDWLTTQEGQAFLADTGAHGAALYQLATLNPNLYSNPRLVRFGLRTSF